MMMLVDQDRRARRGLQILTGATTWALITAPLWAAAVAPELWLYFFTAFSLYWLYRSVSSVLHTVIAYRRIVATETADCPPIAWDERARRSVRHLVVIPTFKEPIELLQETLDALAAQQVPREQVAVVLAFEEADPTAPARARHLRAHYRGVFGHLWTTLHPRIPGEPQGKAANLSYAIPIAHRLLRETGEGDPERVILTVCDSDSRLHPRYLAVLTDTFLADPNRLYSLYQPGLIFHANRDRVPFFLRPINGLHSIVQLSRLASARKLITQSTYSLCLAACEAIGYWEPEVVPEDSHIFFKMFFRWGEKTRVRPIYLPVLAEAPEGPSLWRTILAQYRQARRWSWGVSDVPWLVLTAARSPHVPLRLRLVRVGDYTKEHLLWPTHWFVLAGGLNFVARLAPEVAGTLVYQELALLSSAAIGASALTLVALMWVDQRLGDRYCPPLPLAQRCLGLLAWTALPVLGFPLLILPAVEAHTRLLLGDQLGYQVTEKAGRAARSARRELTGAGRAAR